MVWIPREENELADFYSRCLDDDDWRIADSVFQLLERRWGPHNVDRFATHYNTKCILFNSRVWCPGTQVVDAFSVTWAGVTNWLVPPVRLIMTCLEKLETEKAQATLVLPKWPSAPYWPKVCPDGIHLNNFVTDWLDLPNHRAIHGGMGNNGIFNGQPLTFRLLALHLRYDNVPRSTYVTDSMCTSHLYCKMH